MMEFATELYPHPPQPDRRWRARHPRTDRPADPAWTPRDPHRRQGARLDRAAGVEPARGVESGIPLGRRIVDFADHSLHLVGYSAPVHGRMSLDELRPHLHSLPEQPGLDPLPHLLLRGDVGFLPAAPAARVLAGRRVRSVHRRLARRRLDDLGRVPAAGHDRRGGADLQPRLPSPTGERQPLGNRGRRPSRRSAGRCAEAPLQLPLPVRPGRHRRDRLAGAEP